LFITWLSARQRTCRLVAELERKFVTMTDHQKYWNETIETMSFDEVHEKVQQPKFLKQVKYVLSNSPFYRKKFKDAGLEPGDIKGLADLPKIPFTTKDEIRESQFVSPPLGEHMACGWDTVRRIYSSSGTTGRPAYIGLSKHDISNVWLEIASRAHYCNGFRSGDRVVLTVRPEALSLHRAGSAGGAVPGRNVMRGVVREGAFLGNTVDYRVEVGDGSVLRVQGSPVEILELGAEVDLSFSPSSAWLIPA